MIEQVSSAAKGIEKSISFRELYERIKLVKEIQGTKKKYAAEELIKIIEAVRTGVIELKYITNTYKIKETVAKLLEGDEIFKNTQNSKQKS